MTESFIIVSVIGLLAGFFFSVPIAGPISILITSNALKGRFKFCIRTAIGGAIIEFFYVFIAVYGLTSLYSYYQNVIPIILIVGSLFLLFVAYRIIRTKLKIEDLNKSDDEQKYQSGKGGVRTGFILNLTNPSLFLGWFTSSFLLLSFASSIGLNTGGLDLLMHENVSNMEEITGKEFETFKDYDKLEDTSSPIDKNGNKSLSSLLLSIIYATMVSLGSTIWFYILVKFLIHFREKLNINWLNGLIKVLGVFLIGISFYLIYEGISILSR